MVSSPSFDSRQRGVTLTELMIALVLGALVVLAATSVVVTSRGTYRNQDEATRIAESSRFGLELMNRMVRLAGYTNYGDDQALPAFYTPDAAWISTDAYALNGPNLAGANNSTPSGGPGSGYNGSDSIAIRYYGSSNGNPGPSSQPADGNVLDCAGIGVPSPTSDAVAYTTSRAYNVLFVDTDVDGEPALKCQRQTYDATTGAPIAGYNTQTLIRGVESFQVLYGEGTFAAGADPDSVPPISIAYHQGIGGSNPVVNWDNVVSVRIAMLLRSGVGAQVDTGGKTYALFGASYPNAGSDSGSLFDTSPLSVSERSRVRRVVETTVFVRNRISPWSQLQGIN